MKSAWSKDIPEEIGWYWMKCRVRGEAVKTPCFVDRFQHQGKEIYFVDPANGPRFSNTTRKWKKMEGAKFGPRIDVPKG